MIWTHHINAYQFLAKPPKLLEILLNLKMKFYLFYSGPEAGACPACTQGRPVLGGREYKGEILFII